MLEITTGEPTGLSLLGNPPLQTLPTLPQPPGITFSGVSFTYPEGRIPALEQVSFILPPGSHTAIIGQIGSGKSSLAALLLGYYRPQEGKICLGDIPLEALGKEALCDHISLVEQNPYLFTASLRENLELAAGPKSEEELWAALQWAGLFEMASALPQKLDTLLSPQGQNFSSGERQRLALARMYLENKPVVILDEALKNLDNLTANLLLERILSFCKDRTLLMISHDQQHPAQMDYLLHMEHGHAHIEPNRPSPSCS